MESPVRFHHWWALGYGVAMIHGALVISGCMGEEEIGDGQKRDRRNL
jgi:hypothetical protein